MIINQMYSYNKGLGQTSSTLTWLVAIAMLGLFLVSGSSRYRVR